MEELILFGLAFLTVFLIYEVVIFRLAKKILKRDVELSEVNYLEKKYKLDMKKINYKSLKHVIAFTSSLDIAWVVSIIMLFKGFALEIIVGFISLIILILISYHIVYLIYKKKGMIKNESKRNRK